MPEKWETLQVDGQAMRAFTAAPQGRGPFPAVVVAQHGAGVDPFVQEMTRRLAAAGYFGIAPDLFHRLDPNISEPMGRIGRLRDTEIIADVKAAVDFLGKNRAVRSDRIGITGFCMGGRVVFLMAAANPIFKAAVPFYGAMTMLPWGEGPTPFQRLADTHCPILGFFGEEDQNPSPEDMRKLDAELTRHGKPHEFHSYPGTNHSYMDFTNPTRYREQESKASWELMLSFFEKHLGRVPVAR